MAISPSCISFCILIYSPALGHRLCVVSLLNSSCMVASFRLLGDICFSCVSFLPACSSFNNPVFVQHYKYVFPWYMISLLLGTSSLCCCYFPVSSACFPSILDKSNSNRLVKLPSIYIFCICGEHFKSKKKRWLYHRQN